jgi:BASS family bile acid:Na+ symporter
MSILSIAVGETAANSQQEKRNKQQTKNSRGWKMKRFYQSGEFKVPVILASLLIVLIVSGMAQASEDLYRRLSMIAKSKGDVTLIQKFNSEAGTIDWTKSSEILFEGNLRLLKAETLTGTEEQTSLFLIRNINGDLYILSVPPAAVRVKDGDGAFYVGLEKMLENKMIFRVQTEKREIGGETYAFARFIDHPRQLFFDRIFKLMIILMLFFVMLGMGLTLTMKDFKLVFLNPRGIIAGAFLQWVIMPLVAAGLGRLLGFYEAFPFIYVGLVLITVSPGGVTSNLMTYYAKGDLALSISLTSFSTVLSLVFTPLLLTFYCANLPEVTMPVKLVVQTIIILVIIPLALGMSARSRWPGFSQKATPFFSILGVIALLFLIIAGLISNIEMFADTERYGFTFYSTVFVLTLLGMLVGGIFPKLVGINNYQTRAISLETGLRNATLAMAIALLIQDYMGDFYSSMFFTSGLFGLWMYVAGFLSIGVYKKVLPLEPQAEAETSG